MGHLPSGDRSARSSNGANGRHSDPSTAADLPNEEQTLAEAEQTLSDSDQTLADADQTGSDSDQESADCDQVAADRDQAASDRDLERGADEDEHDVTRDIRERATRQREQTSDSRLQIAGKRDAGAHARDLAALLRDQNADARDLEMIQRDAAHDREADRRAITGADVGMRVAEQGMRAALNRSQAAAHRSQAAEHRSSAAQDREAAAQDREQAARDLAQALADRDALADRLAVAETDAVSGARRRAAGLVDLDHEISRCRRRDAQLVVCYMDVVGLKTLNDSEGHGAGDELLQRVVSTVRTHVRTDDLIIRLGGDEFLCAMSNTSLPDARRRLDQVAGALSASPGGGAIRVGFAQLAPDESATQLIARADSELLDRRN